MKTKIADFFKIELLKIYIFWAIIKIKYLLLNPKSSHILKEDILVFVQ